MSEPTDVDKEHEASQSDAYDMRSLVLHLLILFEPILVEVIVGTFDVRPVNDNNAASSLSSRLSAMWISSNGSVLYEIHIPISTALNTKRLVLLELILQREAVNVLDLRIFHELAILTVTIGLSDS